MQRRKFINHGSAVMALAASAGLIATPSFAQNAAGWNKGAFDGKSLNDVVKAMGGTTATASADVFVAVSCWLAVFQLPAAMS